MNSVQLHLALTHVPVILSLIGLVMLIVALVMKNKTVMTTSYFLLMIAGLAALPVFFTGEGAEESVENIAGVSEAVIEKHEEVAKMAMISIAIAGLLAMGALFSARWQTASRILRPGVLLLALISGVLMIQTAHLGGQIRHSEIRNTMAMDQADGNGGAGEQGEAKGEDED